MDDRLEELYEDEDPDADQKGDSGVDLTNTDQDQETERREVRRFTKREVFGILFFVLSA